MITATQARVIYEVSKEHGCWVNKSFTPQELFADDNRARLALQELTLAGLVAMDAMPRPVSDEQLRHVVVGKDGNHYRLRMTMEALAAYDRWVGMGLVSTGLVSTGSTNGGARV
jgi:hypothetical protein